MKIKQKLILLLILLICGSFFSCKKIISWVFQTNEGDPLTIEQQSYEGHLLRFDGYYYRIIDSIPHFDVMFLNRNGVCSYWYFSATSLNELNQKIPSYDFARVKMRTLWGLFQITDEHKFICERWYDKEFKDPLYHFEGMIINDTSFVLEKSWLAKNRSKEEVEHRVYTFCKLDYKPDSVSKFIESSLPNNNP